MSHIQRKSLVALASCAAVALPAMAELSSADLAKLGTTLTPLGAEKAGNAAGTIPAWTGGITQPVAGFVAGGYYPDPFASDRPLVTIDKSNVERYKENLTPGEIAMIRKY